MFNIFFVLFCNLSFSLDQLVRLFAAGSAGTDFTKPKTFRITLRPQILVKFPPKKKRYKSL
jgi:hypothetical protein